MGKPYASELARLRESYEWAISCDISRLRQAIAIASTCPLVAIGSGGSITCAYILSGLHQRHAGRLSSVQTPLEAASFHVDPAAATWLLTAGGSNVDILNIFEVLVNQEPGQLAILCSKIGSSLEVLAKDHPFVDFVGFNPPVDKDGFLATNSLFASAVLLTRAYLEEFRSKTQQLWGLDLPLQKMLSSDEPWRDLRKDVSPLLSRETIIVLYGPHSKAGALDLESKFSEAALGHVQIADFRNFGHGRHYWLARHSDKTSVLALVSSADKEIAGKTLEQLPEGIPVAQVMLEGDADIVALSSLLVAFYVAGWAGEECGIDPGRPGVPAFGERLYSLSVGVKFEGVTYSHNEKEDQLIIQRKTGKRKNHHQLQGTWDMWMDALTGFKANLSAAAFSAVVFDYDGTIVETKLRFCPPTPAIVSELIRLLQHGIIIGIATGRGRSVRTELQACLPREYWHRVLVGYYNGAEVGLLYDDKLPNNEPKACAPLESALDSLGRSLELKKIAKITVRPYQITLELQQVAPEHYLWEVVNQVLIEANATDVILLRSSHSVDVLAPEVSKTAVVEAIKAMICDGSEVLKIGDRGRWPGNDYSLLSEPFSLSVDECNTSANTCWNLGSCGQRGAYVTLEYLRNLNIIAGEPLAKYYF